MKFEVILQDNKKIVLTKEEADIISKGIFDRQDVFKVGVNIFKRSAIKGVFPIQEENTDNKDQWLRANREWHETCLKMSKRTPEEKTTIELTNRIIPGLELNKIKLSDQQIAVIETNIKNFFDTYPKYPRCPMKVWWPFIADHIAPINEKTKKRSNPNISKAKWWSYVSRNDNAIIDWLKYQ